MFYPTNSTRKLVLNLALFIVVISIYSCKKNLTLRQTVYTETFEDAVPNEITAVTGSGDSYVRMIRPFNGSNVMGMFNNTLVSLELDSLPNHNMIYVEFDFYAHDGWEGNKISTSGIVDVWNIQVNGQLQLSTTFSNTPENKQSYPDWIGSGEPAPPRANSIDTLVTGFCAYDFKPNGSSKYRIVFSRPHTDNELLLQFNDALQGSTCNKSWSIDNIHIETITN
jgi:hypothetical protein